MSILVKYVAELNRLMTPRALRTGSAQEFLSHFYLIETSFGNNYLLLVIQLIKLGR